MPSMISGEIENSNDYVQYIIGDKDKMKQLLCLSIMRKINVEYEAKLLDKTSNYNWEIYANRKIYYLESKISNWCIKNKVSLLKYIAVKLMSNKENVCFKLRIKANNKLMKNKFI